MEFPLSIRKLIVLCGLAGAVFGFPTVAVAYDGVLTTWQGRPNVPSTITDPAKISLELRKLSPPLVPFLGDCQPEFNRGYRAAKRARLHVRRMILGSVVADDMFSFGPMYTRDVTLVFQDDKGVDQRQVVIHECSAADEAWLKIATCESRNKTAKLIFDPNSRQVILRAFPSDKYWITRKIDRLDNYLKTDVLKVEFKNRNNPDAPPTTPEQALEIVVSIPVQKEFSTITGRDGTRYFFGGTWNANSIYLKREFFDGPWTLSVGNQTSGLWTSHVDVASDCQVNFDAIRSLEETLH